jgi:uncharacterized cupredoxin-like copper-binding protein
MRFKRQFLRWVSLLILAVFAAFANAAGAPAQAVQTVDVKLVGLKIEMPATLSPGLTTFKVMNTGDHKHSFKIKGNRLDRKLAKDLKGGESGELQVDLKPGTYQVSCPIAFHKKKGMKMQLTVTP